jgi:hypothetical protein
LPNYFLDFRHYEKHTTTGTFLTAAARDAVRSPKKSPLSLPISLSESDGCARRARRQWK